MDVVAGDGLGQVGFDDVHRGIGLGDDVRHHVQPLGGQQHRPHPVAGREGAADDLLALRDEQALGGLAAAAEFDVGQAGVVGETGVGRVGDGAGFGHPEILPSRAGEGQPAQRSSPVALARRLVECKYDVWPVFRADPGLRRTLVRPVPLPARDPPVPPPALPVGAHTVGTSTPTRPGPSRAGCARWPVRSSRCRSWWCCCWWWPLWSPWWCSPATTPGRRPPPGPSPSPRPTPTRPASSRRCVPPTRVRSSSPRPRRRGSTRAWTSSSSSAPTASATPTRTRTGSATSSSATTSPRCPGRW